MKLKEVIKTLTTRNPEDFNITKTCEELAELQEVLLKKLNKRGGEKEPPDQEIVDEIGDVRIRLEILEEMYGWKEPVIERVAFKLRKFKDYILTNKYKKI